MDNNAPITPDFKLAHDALQIRPLDASDWEAFKGWARYSHKQHGRSAEANALLEAQPDTMWQKELSHPNWKYFAAIDQGKIVSLGQARNLATCANAYEVLLEVADGLHGAGIGTKIYSAMRDYIATEHPGMDMIARILPHNMASRRAAEKAGLSYTGRTERAIPPSETGYMIYGISAQMLSQGPQALPPKPPKI